MRWVSTRVFPEPAPASTSSGPSPCVTASRWAGLRSASRRSTASAPGSTGAPYSASALTAPRIVRGAAPALGRCSAAGGARPALRLQLLDLGLGGLAVELAHSLLERAETLGERLDRLGDRVGKVDPVS